MKPGAKIAMAVFAVILIGLTVFGMMKLFGRNDYGNAIAEFEDGDYIDSLIILNSLAKKSGYEESEKIFYYRCRSISGLADQLEEKFDDELKEISAEKKNAKEYAPAKNKIENKLRDINKKTDGDLALVTARKKSRIVSTGKFQDEFIAKYRGSAYIEDLDFDSLVTLEKKDPEKLLNGIAAFYGKYPNTNYLSQIVKKIFGALHEGTRNFSDKEKIIWEIIVKYLKKFPTSPETASIYQSKGDNVNLRNSPGLEGKPVGKIPKDDILIQLERSVDMAQVGETRDYWYRVSSLRGLRGWIFGKFLSPVDLSKYQDKEEKESWSVEDFFTDWADSNTPSGWMHVKDADKSAIRFTVRGDKKILQMKSSGDEKAGLYSRYNATRAFSIYTRARLTGGDAVALFAYTLPSGGVFEVMLLNSEVGISGRKIPLQTADWHEYRLKSDDGVHATLMIDGEVVASRIPSQNNNGYPHRGLYLLCSIREKQSEGEVEFVRIR